MQGLEAMEWKSEGVGYKEVVYEETCMALGEDALDGAFLELKTSAGEIPSCVSRFDNVAKRF